MLEIQRKRVLSAAHMQASRNASKRPDFQFVAVCEHYFLQIPDRLPVLRGMQHDGHLVSRFQRVFRPAGATKQSGLHRFATPPRHFSIGILHIEENLTVRVTPNEIRDGRLQAQTLRQIELGVAVMSKCRNTIASRMREVTIAILTFMNTSFLREPVSPEFTRRTSSKLFE